MRFRFLGPAALVAILLACGSTDGGGNGGVGPGPDSTVGEDSLLFLRPAPAAPAFGTRTLSFWAIRGERTEVRLMYQLKPGQVDSTEFVRFRIDDKTLVSDSAGNPLATGDSVRITMSVSDTLRLIIEFQPSGLVFNPSKPARLWIKFGEADHDINEDGLVTAADTTLLLGLKIWKQEQLALPWSLLTSTVDTVEQEVEADIAGFTRFAVAY